MDSFPVGDDVFEAELLLKPFNLRLNVSFMQEDGERGPTSRQLAALERFQFFPTTFPATIEPFAIEYCDRIDDIVCLDVEGIVVDRTNISQHYRVTDLEIPRLADTSADFFFLTADCDWEPEHGMQLVLDGQEILYCDDHTPLAFGAAWNRVLSAPDNERRAVLRAEIAKL